MSVVTLHDTTGAEMARVVDPPDPRLITFEIEHTGIVGSVAVDSIPVCGIPPTKRVPMAKGWTLTLDFVHGYPARDVLVRA